MLCQPTLDYQHFLDLIRTTVTGDDKVMAGAGRTQWFSKNLVVFMDGDSYVMKICVKDANIKKWEDANISCTSGVAQPSDLQSCNKTLKWAQTQEKF